MGVLGLAPFLQKTCPDVFKTFPNRLKGLSGKKIVIDGTLLTQRLHFAPMPHPYRHVLGWYRVIKELKESNVTALCVFDGKQRSLAKQHEVERRRKVRRETAARGALEVDRLQRLRKLNTLLGLWGTLSSPAQESAKQTLKSLLSESTTTPAEPSPLPTYVAGNMDLPIDVDSLSKPPNLDYLARLARREAFGDFHHGDLAEVLLKRAGIPVSSSQDLDSEPFSQASQADTSTTTIPAAIEDSTSGHAPISTEHIPSLQALSLEDTDLARVDESYELIDELIPEDIHGTVPPKPSETSNIAPEQLASALGSLYREYRQSIPQLESLSLSVLPPAVSRAVSEDEANDAKEEYVMSKTQHQLVVDEGKFWEQLAQPPAEEVDQVSPLSMVTTLTQKSNLISESYERRTHPPTTETYEDSKAILRAMGVPCIETSGPFEAEALASSLVINGYADYVASEDMDVLVYEAPLIRNLSNRNGPIVIVSGSDVRNQLQLNRPSFVDFALLLGTDFSQRIKNVGPARALKFIREYGSIESVLEHETQYPPRIPLNLYLEQVGLARSVFQTLPPTPDDTLLEPIQCDQDEVLAIMEQYNLSREVTDEWDYQAALAGNYFNDNPAAT